MTSADLCYRKDPLHPNPNSFRILIDYRCNHKESDGHSMCCSGGDVCLSDGLCSNAHPPIGSTGYYTGSCTDPSLSSDACIGTRRCIKEILSDTVYNNETSSWRCCGAVSLAGGYRATCSDPTGITFNAPSPEALRAKQNTAPSNSPTSSAPTPSESMTAETTAAGIPTTSSRVDSTNSSPPGLSTGAVAGIGVGSALAGALFIGLLIWAVFRQKKALKRKRLALVGDGIYVGMVGTSPEPPRKENQRYELIGHQRRENQRYELR